MKKALHNYDIYPKIFPINKEITITIKPLDRNRICKTDVNIAVELITEWDGFNFKVTPDEKGCFKFNFTAPKEGEYFVRVRNEENDEIVKLSVYALEPDLACRYPLKGDLHVHTSCSDGTEAPEVVCANYRKLGYDFIVITDHHFYFPSLDAQKAYKDTDIAMCIIQGEEVHLPGNEVHIVNAGGLFSVNGLLKEDYNYKLTNGSIDGRRLNADVNPPDVMTDEEFNKEIDALIEKLNAEDPIPANVNARWYACCVWAFEKIKEAKGVGIFAHPYWTPYLFQISEPFTRYMLKKHPFDAFEVLGGELYYHQNGLQSALYYDEYREGRIHPIVGSTDSHGSTEHNKGVTPCHTIVFAEKNESEYIVSAIKARYSIAVDTISKEYRLVGEYRLQKYATFLVENYFPVLEKSAINEGSLMFDYVNGDASAEELNVLSRRSKQAREKYVSLL